MNIRNHYSIENKVRIITLEYICASHSENAELVTIGMQNPR